MLRWLRYQIRNYFAFNRKETNGTIVLILLMVLLLAVPFFYALYLDATAPATASADNAKLDSLMAMLDNRQIQPRGKPLPESGALTNDKPAVLFAFDPNTASVDDWQRLGVAKKMAERIDKYRSKGGKFRIKADLMKIYGFPEPLFVQLKPYITLPDSILLANKKAVVQEVNAKPASPVKPSRPLGFDLNKADSVMLISLRGIGSGYARRILNYRDKLGGFVRQEQVREVYGLDSAAAEEVLRYSFVESSFMPVQLNINLASVDELKAHPYISANLARLIVAYRQQHGAYRSVEEIKSLKLLKEEDYTRLIPYLRIQ